jgi:hypothetical protein
VLKKPSWKGGELRMSLNEPFDELRLSNHQTVNVAGAAGRIVES